MKKSKKYLVIIKKYTIGKREPNIKVLDLVDTEEEALKKCNRKYSDIIEVGAENGPQDQISHKKTQKYIDFADSLASVYKDKNGKVRIKGVKIPNQSIGLSRRLNEGIQKIGLGVLENERH